MTQKILVIEDDKSTADFLVSGFTESGFCVDAAYDSRDGLFHATDGSYDVIVLDRMLPGMNGMAVLSAIRAADIRTPVILLSALGAVGERVEGLTSGADDYLTKPFAFSELVARIRLLIGRKSLGSEVETSISCADLNIDLLARRVTRGSTKIDLQPREFRLLEYFVRHQGQVLTRTMLLEAVWDYHFDPGTNVVDAGLVSLGITGDYVYFGTVTRYDAIWGVLLLAPMIGVLGGLAGGIFARLLVEMATSTRRPFVLARAHPLALAFACGLLVAAAGLASGASSWGTGYETTRQLLNGEEASLAFGPAKFVASLATALSGAPGGILAPSLSVGAGLGQIVAFFAKGEPSGALILLGVAAYFTGVVRAPLTAVIIVMEMTADRSMIMPLFIAAIVADWVSGKICHTKLYHALSVGFRPVPTDKGST